MPIFKFSNNFKTTLVGNITDSQPTITVASVVGLPSIVTGEQYSLTITDGTNIEEVIVTAASSNTLTVLRNVDNRGSYAFGNNSLVEMRPTATQQDGFIQRVNGLQGKDIELDTDDIDEGATNKYASSTNVIAGLKNASLSNKSIPVGADLLFIKDSEDSNNIKTTRVDELPSSGGGGAVDSVNGEVGVVVLNQDDILDGTTYKQYSDTEKSKLAGIEAGADVTDLTNVLAALNGASLTSTTVATDDKVIIQDTSNANNIRTVLTQAIADLALGRGWVLLGSATASNSAALNFTSLISSTYDEYAIVGVDLRPVNDGDIIAIRTSSNNGSSYDSGASDYKTSGVLTVSGSTTLTVNSSTGRSEMFLNGTIGNAAAEAGTCTCFLSGVNSSNYKLFKLINTQITATGEVSLFNISGARMSTSVVNAFTVFANTGNISSGSVYLFGVKKS